MRSGAPERKLDGNPWFHQKIHPFDGVEIVVVCKGFEYGCRETCKKYVDGDENV